MITVDITADLNGEDETGDIRTLLDEARDPSTFAAEVPPKAGASTLERLATFTRRQRAG